MGWDDGPLVAHRRGVQPPDRRHARAVAAGRPLVDEKVCAMAAARDGSLQLGFGLGKYTNRNVIDGYAGVSRGK